jgi:chloride channel protein, CIC family
MNLLNIFKQYFKVSDKSTPMPIIWGIALFIGVVVGYIVIGFRHAIIVLQETVYGADELTLAFFVNKIDWKVFFFTPILTGFLISIILYTITVKKRASGVADVIEARTLHKGYIHPRDGLGSALVAWLSLGAGGSAGREGPAVHMAASIASIVSKYFDLNAIHSRTILGCGVAAAVSASFNAPIAGALFALEVILGHYAVRTFAPIVIASVAGTIVCRTHIGDYPAFFMPDQHLGSMYELPAFVVLGIVCAAVAIIFMRTLCLGESAATYLSEMIKIPEWLRPPLAGVALGALALEFPKIIGVGYIVTGDALEGDFGFTETLILVAVKILAVTVTLAGRFGGGVFSPSLMLGALVGSAFGLQIMALFPDIDTSSTVYAWAGMGAIAAAVLGAPISTSLIVFELTGDYQTAIVVMVCVSVAVAIAREGVNRNFFLTQLARRGVHLSRGPQKYLLSTMTVKSIMRPTGSDDSPSETFTQELVEQGVILAENDTLEKAFPMFANLKNAYIPVMRETELIGTLFHLDALKAYNRALIEVHEEEHS